MEVRYREQRNRSAGRDENGEVASSYKPWVGFVPVINGVSLELPAHSVFVAGRRFDLLAESFPIEDGHLYLDDDGEYHFVAQEFVGETGSKNEAGVVKPIEGWGYLRLLWIEGEVVNVLRSME